MTDFRLANTGRSRGGGPLTKREKIGIAVIAAAIIVIVCVVFGIVFGVPVHHGGDHDDIILVENASGNADGSAFGRISIQDDS